MAPDTPGAGGASTVAEPPAPVGAGGGRRPAARRTRAANAKLVRRLHVWTSMTSLVVMLFFGATGILLNHENWTLGSHETMRTASGMVPASKRSGGTFDTLTLEQYVAGQEKLGGSVSGQGLSGTQLWVTWAGPGYQARMTADTSTGAYQVTEDKQGLVGVLDDVHRAKNTGPVWRAVNDVAGALLVFIGLTGLLITWLTRARNRRRDLALGAIGLVLAALALWSAVG